MSIVSHASTRDKWILVSSCTFHMSHNREWFKNLKLQEVGIVFMDNNNLCKLLGSSDVALKLHDGKVRLLINVKFVLGLKQNMISLDTLDELGLLKYHTLASYTSVKTITFGYLKLIKMD